ncbi:SURF1 family protein [Nocardioides anomalus]|uniref:SURF1-like protein n=1 Tax=Nocardioides anomalus TaxID=2712223 RepID=A0A6G6WD98_9ACTN|nr:SURF1 family protein [Nocardioides anomalus]QIG43127.1 SURF1 family protein [Nocardioides anomalus]
MRSLRFLLSRRWILFALVVVMLTYAAWWLGGWQFRRLDDRKASNEIVRTNEHRQVTPVGEVLTPDGDPTDADEWRVVSASGTYDADSTVLVRYRTRDGAQGVDVVVPLVTADGTALLVDRGWLETDPSGADADVPAPPSGEVEVTGYVRANGTGDSTRVDDLSTRAISSDAIGPAIGRPVYGGFVELRSEDPEPATSLEAVELPELNNGPHFFYGLQWWFFGLLAVFGFFYLLVDEWRNGPASERPPVRRKDKAPRPKSRARLQADAARRQIEAEKAAKKAAQGRPVDQSARSAPPSTGSMAPDTNDAAGESRKAAARPNSSGSP